MRIRLLAVMLSIFAVGCSQQPDASEASARSFFDAEFRKWMAGQQDSEATHLELLGVIPIGYNIRSVVPDTPHPLDSDKNEGEQAAWRLNVVIECESQAGTPLEKVVAYTLTWIPSKREWSINERL